ncbi:MAG TPA: hypothetical protein VFH17_04410, partial [Coriobacteriia bacterium]|nr:hypothetical protein [Coriobacteriia bacterium]
AVTLERVPRAVTALNARYLPLYSEVLEELLPAESSGREVDRGDRRGTVTCFLALVVGLPIILSRQPGAVTPETGTVMRLFDA